MKTESFKRSNHTRRLSGCRVSQPSYIRYIKQPVSLLFPEKGTTSSLSFDTEKWSNEVRNTEEASNYNHARAFNPADSSFYFFGGYGFYQYRNDLYRMKSGSGKVEQIEYERPLYPRYSAAMAVVGDELYIFGGRGNKYGKQELSTHYYWGLCAINLKTKQSRIVWQKTIPKRTAQLWLHPCISNHRTVPSTPSRQIKGAYCGRFR